MTGTLLVNTAQEEAINTINGHVIIVSCPGSGKTTTLIRRIHHMIEEGVEPSSILMVTFTKAAAAGMQTKYKELFGENPGVTFRTLHSLCYNILKAQHLVSQDRILSEHEINQFFYNFVRPMRYGKSSKEIADAIQRHIGIIKNNNLNPSDYRADGIEKEVLIRAYYEYAGWKKEVNKVDFDDLLVDCLSLLNHNPGLLAFYQSHFKYIQCDEYQDTNYLQRDLLYLLSAASGNLCVVGDDDQSIYGFRGARPEIMLGFMGDFPDAKKIMMGTNYRSAQKIVDFSDKLIKNNKARYSKGFTSSRGEAGVEGKVFSSRFLSKKEELSGLVKELKAQHRKGTEYRDMAVLFRINAQVQLIAAELTSAKIPYCSTEAVSTIYDSVIFTDIKDYVDLSSGRGTDTQLMNVLNHPNRYFREYNFRGCKYTPSSLIIAARYLRDGSTDWKYEQAIKSINTWMYNFGPGKVSYDSKPADIINRLTGPSSIHYDKFIYEYAKMCDIPETEMTAMFQELKDDASRFATVHEWFDYARSYSEVVRGEASRKRPDGVVLSTMHKAKGLEWKTVFIVDADQGITPHSKSIEAGLANMIEEERRLFYVAMTRAKDNLFIYGCGKKSMFIKETFGEPKEKTETAAPASALVKTVEPGRDYIMDPSEVPVYPPGKAVKHKSFGKGKVVSYGEHKIVVQFVEAGEKVLQFPESFARGLIEYCV